MSNRTDTATRLIPASPEAITRAFVDPEALMAWLPPKGMSGRTLLFEPWEGGRYRIDLSYETAAPPGARARAGRRAISAPDASSSWSPAAASSRSVEFESDDPAFAGEMIVTWAFEPAPEGTNVSVTAENVPSGISAEDHAAGLASSLENLACFVSSD